MTIRRVVRKRKTFKSGITKELIMLLLLGFGSSGYLIYFGANRIIFYSKIKFLGTLDCILGGYMPVVIAAVILITGFALILKGFNQYLVVTPISLAYQKGKSAFNENWDKLEYIPPQQNKKFLRCFYIGTHDNLVRIDSFFFSKFDTISEVVRIAKESRKTKMMEGMDLNKIDLNK